MPDPAAPELDLTTVFSGPPPRPRVSPFYALALVLVAACMLLLPALYVAFVAAAGWLVFWHATENVTVLTDARGPGVLRLAFLVYAVPLVAGGLGLLFLVKPLFAPRGRSAEPFTLTPAEEPRLFQYVELLCDLMGAPTPRRIDVNCEVNAGAGFRGGLLSLLTGDLVLVIGLPLASGLPLREFTGVLAHEFGHFTQGWAMRLSYFIRRINGWFARVVYERDAWDERIEEWRRGSGHWAATLAVWLASAFVGLSRLVLKALMYVGLGVSAFLTRQQEFNADAWEAGVAGSHASVEASRLMRELSVCQRAASEEIERRWRAGTLPDNLMGLLNAMHAKLSEEARRALDEHARKSRTAWYHTHPAEPERNAHVLKLDLPGVFRGAGPASALFRDFDEVCRRASYLQYRMVLGRRLFDATLIPTAGVVRQIDEREQREAASTAYLGGLVTPLAPLALSQDARKPPADPAAALAELRACRAVLEPLLPRLPAALDAWIEADNRLDVLAGAKAVVETRLVLLPGRFGLADNSRATLTAETAAAEARAGAAGEAPLAAAPLLARRLELALSILRLPEAAKKLPDAAERVRAVDAMLDWYAPLLESLRNLWACTRLRTSAVAVAQATRPEDEGPRVNGRLRQTGEEIQRRLRGVRELLAGVRFTPQDSPEVALNAWVIPVIPPADALPSLFQASSECQGQLLRVYQQVLTDLSQHAQAVETALGLAPLGAPKPAA